MASATPSNLRSHRNCAQDSKQTKAITLGTQSAIPPSGYESQGTVASIDGRKFGGNNTTMAKQLAYFGFSDEFSNTLIDLNTTSNNLSQTLDKTYSSILQKLSVLQTTVNGLRELSAMTQQLNVEFKTEGDEILHESTAQLDSFDDFKEQAVRITELKERVNIGRKNIINLGDRVMAVRKRVESWESLERERRNKTKYRLRVMFACIGSVIALIFLFRVLPLLWMQSNTNTNYSQASPVDDSSRDNRLTYFTTDDILSEGEKNIRDASCGKKDIKNSLRKIDEL